MRDGAQGVLRAGTCSCGSVPAREELNPGSPNRLPRVLGRPGEQGEPGFLSHLVGTQQAPFAVQSQGRNPCLTRAWCDLPGAMTRLVQQGN